MTKRYEFIGKLTDYERKNNSYYGNPKFYGCFESDSGEVLEGTTATNAGCAYGFLNSIDKLRKLTYHITRKGNTIIDFIEIL